MTGLAPSTTNEMDVSSKSCLEHGKFSNRIIAAGYGTWPFNGCVSVNGSVDRL